MWFATSNDFFVIVFTIWIYIMLKVKDQTQVMKWNLWKWHHCNIINYQLSILFYMCALTMFQTIENLWNYMKILHKKNWFSMFPFLQHMYMYNYEHVWFIDATPWTWANKWKGMMSKKLEKLKIGHEEQEIVIKHNFNTNDAKVLAKLHDNLNSTCKTLTNYSNLKIITIWCFTIFSQHRLHPFHLFWIIKLKNILMMFYFIDVIAMCS